MLKKGDRRSSGLCCINKIHLIYDTDNTDFLVRPRRRVDLVSLMNVKSEDRFAKQKSVSEIATGS